MQGEHAYDAPSLKHRDRPDNTAGINSQAEAMEGAHVAIYISGFQRVYEEMGRRSLVFSRGVGRSPNRISQTASS